MRLELTQGEVRDILCAHVYQAQGVAYNTIVFDSIGPEGVIVMSFDPAIEPEPAKPLPKPTMRDRVAATIRYTPVAEYMAVRYGRADVEPQS